jgi:hypothetical protein
MGTISFISPEQARGNDVDHRADIWSFGVVLYEMITGQLPFRGEFDQVVLYSIMNEEPAPMTGLRIGVPMELERIIKKAVAKKLDERFQNMLDMLLDFESINKEHESSKSEKEDMLEKPRRRQHSKLHMAVHTFLTKIFHVDKSVIKETEEKTKLSEVGKFNYCSLRMAIRKTGGSRKYVLKITESPLKLRKTTFSTSLKSVSKIGDQIVNHAIKGSKTDPFYSLTCNLQKEYGQKLFKTAFSTGIEKVLYDCCAKIDHNEGLRIQIEIGDDNYLRRIPWELVYEGKELGYLSTAAPRILFYRTEPVKVRRRLSAMKLPLQMLVVFCEPKGWELGCEQEEQELRQVLRPYIDSRLVKVDIAWNPSPHEFQQKIHQNRYHIIHFSGSDAKDYGFQEEGIVLVEELQPRFLQLEELCTIMRGQNTARLFLLNTCLSAQALAPALVRSGVPSVVAMQFSCDKDACIAFPSFFYPAFLAPEKRFQIDVAVSIARTSYFIDQDHFGRDRLDWINPVLTTSVIDGNFFGVL